jgi:hypothetical protein
MQFEVFDGRALGRPSASPFNWAPTKATVEMPALPWVAAKLIPMGIDKRKPEVEAVPRIRARFAGSGAPVVLLRRVAHKNGEFDLVAVSRLDACLRLDEAIDQPSWAVRFEVVNRFTEADGVIAPSGWTSRARR